jgi:cysteine-rich repeat protein
MIRFARIVIGSLGIAVIVTLGCSSSIKTNADANEIASDGDALEVPCIKDGICHPLCANDPDCASTTHPDSAIPDSAIEEPAQGSQGEAGQNIDAPNEGTSDSGKANRDAGEADADDETAPKKDDEAICGDGIIQEGEQCDDGDRNSSDGCTTQCKFTCTENSDCDDSNPCNGEEICNNNHACEDAAEDADDRTPCGDKKSCRKGICIDNVCGDRFVTRDETCDDGNKDPDDGCTPDCEWTCEESTDCVNEDVCLPRVCNTKTHRCEAGTPLTNETECEIAEAGIKALCGSSEVENDGWCINGICTCADCGDGVLAGKETCDDGLLNGTEDSPNGCAIDCAFMECGNGLLDNGEQCDDGNKTRLDGCDSECKYEFVHRVSSLQILKSASPEWCTYGGNRYAEAFPAGILQLFGAINFDIFGLVNNNLNNDAASGTTNFLMHIMNSADTSLVTTDNDITLGIYQGILGPETWENGKPVDFPFYIPTDQVDADRLPTPYHRIAAWQQAGGLVGTKESIEEPAILEMDGLTDKYKIYGFMLQTQFDLDTASIPYVPSSEMKISDTLVLAEESGVDPTGMFCGALEPNALDQPIGQGDFAGLSNGNYGVVASACCKNHGPDRGQKYVPCEDNVLTDDCDSVAKIIHEGCTFCYDISGGLAGLSAAESDCSLMDSNPSDCFEIINGIDYDVDAVGNDGVNDSWSVLFGFDTRRVRLIGTAER